MKIKIHPVAKIRITEIWHYSNNKWGAKTADDYARGIYSAVKEIAKSKHKWKPLKHRLLVGIYCLRYKSHVIFFKELSSKSIAVLSVLHEKMDLPNQIIEDLNK